MARSAPTERARVSVVVPLYNEGDRVFALADHLATIDGIHETILVDASDDPDSVAFLSRLDDESGRFPTLRIVTGQKRGRAWQMNAGARLASGEILLFLHGDTRLPSAAIESIERCAREEKRWGRFDVRLDAHGWSFRVIETMINLRSRVRQLATGDQALFVERALFETVGGFPEIALMEDIGISAQLKGAGRPALIADPVTTSARRWQQQGVLKTILRMWRLRWLYWRGRSPEELAEIYGHAR